MGVGGRLAVGEDGGGGGGGGRGVGGPGGAPGSEWQTEAEEESSLKSLVKIMKTNGDTVSRDGEENFICEASSPAVGWVGGLGGVLRSLGTTEARKTPPPEKKRGDEEK